ncbi:DNA-directed primase/polymerase protein [Marchantia polymorpha subsp. ruderalis]|uniref:DNA-directed primase/polymerase protein n=2 Tax=Marchantia polymorpha TaxID=3197 RepID=A0AAF6C0P8_MARPO|nr:hypothetical protein MARPO_0051s0060 [Marchantia polymorpha]BBN17832.1 hypothetical protein Mp_7g17230 [Marchantia polymorpha subsp. ruderalis]|eukprot:PTQ38457.1 hypothetical protein MARPO_0051s0060 [Marchantia polymorpha]
MADEKASDSDRLVQCFARGTLQRHQNHRRGTSGPNTPTRSLSSSCHNVTSPEAASSEVDMRTPHKTPRLDRPSPSIVLDSRRNGKVPEGNASNQISPGVFYGSPFGKPSNKPLHVLRLLNEIQNDLVGQRTSRDVESAGAFKLASASRAAIWATFPKQEQAIQFAGSNADSKIVVFQYQDHINGQRRFLATSYFEFWQRYRSMLPEHRHHYEIIQEGKPCHMYFDLEFNRKANIEADGEAMVDILLSVVQKAFLDIYALEYDPSWTIELDSTTEDKFSRHLIIRVPGAAFKDNTHVGLFVVEICRRIHNQRDANEDYSRLFVLQGESLASYHTELYIDQAVYSRNRSFRLPFSSKAGKAAKLLPTMRFRCSHMEERDIFMDSLICRIGDECDRLLTFGLENAGHGGTVNYASWKEFATAPPKRPGFCMSGKSPFPALDIFVESVACIGNTQGKIRSWYWFSDYGVIVYNISENRFCENIGRPHKSNNVMYIVDFRTAGYYQKCHDPDCRGYRSPLRPIPGHTIPSEYAPSSLTACTTYGEKAVNGRDQIKLFEDDSEDETWWEEVASSLDSMECNTSQSQSTSQASLHQVEVDVAGDDEWWTSAEPELAALEKCILTQRK